MDEAVYLLQNGTYLHIQETGGGYDYTYYSPALLAEDGGVILTQEPLEEIVKMLVAADYEGMPYGRLTGLTAFLQQAAG